MSRDRILPATGGPDAAAADRWGGGAGPDTASIPAGIDGVLIDGIADWLISSALGRVGVDAIFEGCCQRLHAAGVPLVRALAAFRTLHPLFASVNLEWRLNQGADSNPILHEQAFSTELKRRVLLSAAFAKAAGARCEPLGAHSLRGVGVPVEVVRAVLNGRPSPPLPMNQEGYRDVDGPDPWGIVVLDLAHRQLMTPGALPPLLVGLDEVARRVGERDVEPVAIGEEDLDEVGRRGDLLAQVRGRLGKGVETLADAKAVFDLIDRSAGEALGGVPPGAQRARPRPPCRPPPMHWPPRCVR